MSYRTRSALLASSLTLALSACATSAADPGDMAQAPPATSDRCNADAAQSALGKQASPELVEQARKDADAEVARTLKPGQVVTMEYRAGRLNVSVDANNVVIGARCG